MKNTPKESKHENNIILKENTVVNKYDLYRILRLYAMKEQTKKP